MSSGRRVEGVRGGESVRERGRVKVMRPLRVSTEGCHVEEVREGEEAREGGRVKVMRPLRVSAEGGTLG